MKKMTMKFFNEQLNKKGELRKEFLIWQKKLHDNSILDKEDTIMYQKAKENFEEFEKELIKMMKPYEVNIHYCIGFRTYWGSCYKLGKSYFAANGKKYNASNGYSSIYEVDEITEDMREKMLDDLHYY